MRNKAVWFTASNHKYLITESQFKKAAIVVEQYIFQTSPFIITDKTTIQDLLRNQVSFKISRKLYNTLVHREKMVINKIDRKTFLSLSGVGEKTAQEFFSLIDLIKGGFFIRQYNSEKK